MLLFLTLLLSFSASSEGRITSHNASQLCKDIEDFRNKLVGRLSGLPNEFFEIELEINDLGIEANGTLIHEQLTQFRKTLNEMPDNLFDIELAINQWISKDDKDSDDEENLSCSTWSLGMNLNASDGHIMDYLTGWASTDSIGSDQTALTLDYLNQSVWSSPANYIAIVRHQEGTVDAVKVFSFKDWGVSLLHRFQDMDPGRRVVTEGGPIQVSVAADAVNRTDDPIFSVGGDLAFNWVYTDNGHRIVLTGGYLSPADANDDNTHGLGNNFACDPLTGVPREHQHRGHEISLLQDCPWDSCRVTKVQGTDWDHDASSRFQSGPVYGNYAIYVSQDAETFPKPGYQLGLEVKRCCSERWE